MRSQGSHEHRELRRAELHPDPIRQFLGWFDDAEAAGVVLPNAMALATTGADGRPSVRHVLLREADQRGFVFYTNHGSRKGRQLGENPRAALVFLWKALDRQVSVTGDARRVDDAESDVLAYLVGPVGIDPLAVADQTIFNITSANRGVFSGTGSVTLGRPGQGDSTTDFNIEGVVTPAGQLRIQFTPANPQDAPVTGLGHMEWINHSWRMTMQVASSGSPMLFHWANMTKLRSGQSPPAPVIDPQQCRIVELRFFGGLTIEETAQSVGVSPATVKRDLNVAKAWLHREMRNARS
jgi:uncharacterized pyridoxamine 5'-phosphate oxidase family protein